MLPKNFRSTLDLFLMPTARLSHWCLPERNCPWRASYQDADVRPVMVDDGDQVEQGVICDAVRCSVRPTGHQDHVLLKI